MLSSIPPAVPSQKPYLLPKLAHQLPSADYPPAIQASTIHLRCQQNILNFQNLGIYLSKVSLSWHTLASVRVACKMHAINAKFWPFHFILRYHSFVNTFLSRLHCSALIKLVVSSVRLPLMSRKMDLIYKLYVPRMLFTSAADIEVLARKALKSGMRDL
jgi:hypothetical protein